MRNKIKIQISGMCCESCSNTIESHVAKFDFISKIKINPKKGVSEFDIVGPIEENKTILIATIVDLGYEVDSFINDRINQYRYAYSLTT